MRDERLLILGNGGAALSAVMAARGSGYCGEIHLASDVDGPAFNPMLAPYFLKGAIPWEYCFPFGSGFYPAHDVTCHFGAAAERSSDASEDGTVRRKEIDARMRVIGRRQ